MLAVIIPTLNAEQTLAATLTALIPATVDGLVCQVVIADGGSTDKTLEIADAAGATIITSEKGRGQQMCAGAEHAKHRWLLFLHADTVLDHGWEAEASKFMERVDKGHFKQSAAAFKFRLDDDGIRTNLMEAGVSLRCAALRLPYGDQGLLIPETLYREVGGYKKIPLLEDVDFVRRLGYRRLKMLRAGATTNAARFRREGYTLRVLRNWACLAMYATGIPIRYIVKFYR